MLRYRLLGFISIVLLLLCWTARADDGLVVWGIGQHEALSARFGYQFGNAELGGFGGRVDDGEEDIARYGLYGTYHLPFVLDANDLPILPVEMQTVSYLGLIAGLEDQESNDLERGFYGPAFGLVLQKFIVDNPPLRQEEIQFVTEVQYLFFERDVKDRLGKNDEVRVEFGLRFKF